MPLLRVDRLAVVYGATEVLTDLSFQVEPRQRLGIVGANGSGKSSLLKAISGEITPTRGSLTLAPRTKTAYLAQEIEEIGRASCREKSVDLGGRRIIKKKKKKRKGKRDIEKKNKTNYTMH